MRRTSLVILAAIVAAPSTALATCRMSYVCDDYGRCRYVDICDSQLSLPSIDVPPLPSPPPMSLKPLPSMDLPPLGTQKCEYMAVNGRWQNVCW